MEIVRKRVKDFEYLGDMAHFRRVELVGTYPLHDHEFGEIFWLDKGRCRHCVNGQTFSLHAGDLIFIRPWDQHSFHGAPRRPFFINNIWFEWQSFLYLRQRYFPHQSSLYGEEDALPKMLRLESRQLQRLRQLFLVASRRSNVQERLALEWFLLSLFTEFCPVQPESGKSLPDLPDWMVPAWTKIHEPESFRLGVQEFCRLSGRSREHVSREFRRLVGQTIGQYIHHLRMKHAAFLLETSSLEVIDVSLECGFESLSHFYENFRKVYQTSPRLFRKQAQGKMY